MTQTKLTALPEVTTVGSHLGLLAASNAQFRATLALWAAEHGDDVLWSHLVALVGALRTNP